MLKVVYWYKIFMFVDWLSSGLGKPPNQCDPIKIIESDTDLIYSCI